MEKTNAIAVEDVVLEKPGKPLVTSQIVNADLTEDDVIFLEEYDEKAKSRLYHRIDIRLVPMLALLYLVSHLDRANIGNAKIEGLEKSLGMAGVDYNIAVAIFFVPYILFEVPSNFLLTKFNKPSHYIGGLVIAWGTVMTLTGVVQNFGGLLATRVFLGVFEAGFFPAAMHTIGIWYPPNKTQTRTALFYCAAAIAGAFSGLLAAGIAKMDGLGNYDGWRWIFIIEGIASVIAGIMACYMLPDTPASSKWLTADEVRFLELTHIATRGKKVKGGEQKEKFKYKTLFSVLLDWRIWLMSIVMWSNTVPGYALKFTLPQILRGMGFTSTKAQLLSAPPYAIAATSAICSAILADRFSWRMPIIVGGQVLVIIANSIQFVYAADIANNVALCYFCVFMALAGAYPIIPGVMAWQLNNLAGPLRRAMGIALMVCLGNVGGIIGSFIFLDAEKPKYPTGFGSSLGFAAGGLFAAFALEFVYWRANKKADGMTEDEIRGKYSDQQLEELGDRSPLFRYAL
ncbi:putative transporter [Cyphellophora attinorum]|uniref:Putative transporter n=1 Tax=Cyphellophora attinorum TaxID=1664694 RepID=A0A0N0NJQ1_9EURO|nr:putative transporter [Phialophora attinorum]KPI37148.1 putative transporter [Phialophora attinorum]